MARLAANVWNGKLTRFSRNYLDLREQIGCLPGAPGPGGRGVAAEPTIAETDGGGKREKRASRVIPGRRAPLRGRRRVRRSKKNTRGEGGV